MRRFKVSPMTFQSHPFYRAIWVILRGEMAGITVQNGQDWNARYKSLIINRSELCSIRMHVGTHGSCVRPNALVYFPPILLAWTHEPCVPTCLAACNSSSPSTCLFINHAAWTHGSCVRPNAPVYLPSIPLAWTHEPCVPTYPHCPY